MSCRSRIINEEAQGSPSQSPTAHTPKLSSPKAGCAQLQAKENLWKEGYISGVLAIYPEDESGNRKGSILIFKRRHTLAAPNPGWASESVVRLYMHIPGPIPYVMTWSLLE